MLLGEGRERDQSCCVRGERGLGAGVGVLVRDKTPPKQKPGIGEYGTGQGR